MLNKNVVHDSEYDVLGWQPHVVATGICVVASNDDGHDDVWQL